MIKTLTKSGNSHALVLDRAILELIHIDPEQPVEISTNGTQLIIEPVKDAARIRKFREKLAAVNARHGKTLKRLAE